MRTRIPFTVASVAVLSMVLALVPAGAPAGASTTAVTLWATPSGTATTGCTTQPSASATKSSLCGLGAAISAAEQSSYGPDAVTIDLEHSSGQPCSTSSGCTYLGAVTIDDTNSGSLEISGSGAPQTQVSCGSGCTGATMTLDASTPVTLAGLEVVGGDSANGGGIAKQSGTLYVKGCTVSSNSATASGGGIANESGLLDLTGSEVSGNTAADGGGGILNAAGATLEVSGSLVTSNSSSAGGGGIDNWGNLAVTASTVSDNKALTQYGGGGGVMVSGGTATIADSTISSNSAPAAGGAGIAVDTDGILTVTASTIAGNSASTGGGGIYWNTGGTVDVLDSTIAGNSSTMAGGGIYSNQATVLFAGTIVAGNSSQASSASSKSNDCAGAPVGDGGYDLESGTSCGFTSSTDYQNANGYLSSLADNGGTTLTMKPEVPAPPAGNPAIGAIPASAQASLGSSTVTLCTTNGGMDQVGNPRLAANATSCDIGAYETPVPAPVLSSLTPGSGVVTGGTSVAVSGYYLFGTSAITFGAAGPATLGGPCSPTACQVVTPPASAPGTVDVTATASTGTSLPTGFLYVSPHIPYVPVIPYRIADTRCSSSPQPAPCASESLPAANASVAPPSSGASISLQVTGTGNGTESVPASAQSVVLTVTAIAGPTSHNGYLTVYPTGSTPPTASALNYVPGETVPNLVTVAVGKGGAISVLSSSAGVNVVVDVEGYYEPPTTTVSNLFDPLASPVRVLDTRCDAASPPGYCAGEHIPAVNQMPAVPSFGGVAVDLAGVDGSSGVPGSGASAVSLVLTAALPGAAGYLTVWPDSGSCSSPPETSNVNFRPRGSSADSAIVALPSSGKLCVYNYSTTATNVVMDVNGYFSAAGEALTASAPVRICDTRSASAIGGRGDVVSGVSGQCDNSGIPVDPSNSPTDPMTVQVTGVGGVPSNATAVVANITVESVSGAGYLTAWAAGTTMPATSNLDWTAGATVPNMVVSELSSSGRMAIYTYADANVVIDVVGWYTASTS